MEFVKSAAKSISRKLFHAFRSWSIKCLRSLVWTADEWVHRQEVKLRDASPAAPDRLSDGLQVQPVPAVDRKSSAVRERAHKRAAHPRLPRLRYEQGSWVRQ
jgi:hypothetical protein